MQWKHKFSESQIFEVCQSAGKVCGMSVSSGMSESYTLNLCFMNPKAYGDTLRRQRKAIHRKRLDVCHEVWSFSMRVQSYRAHVGNQCGCSHFTEKLDHPPLILTLRLWTIISWGCLTTDAKIDSSVMRNCKWLFVEGCKCKSPISSRGGFFNSSQDATNTSLCSGIMYKNDDTLLE